MRPNATSLRRGVHEITSCRTADGEQCVGLLPLHARHTLQGVVVRVLLAHVQSALHLTPAEGRLRHQGDLRGLPLGGVGQV